ncbi:MAG TPA: hypothetical protein VLI90_00895 [Tepidisphaeraceae bacterium]|nr:hypothetical protein [Tepidisphaeraceae bacterium]
MRALKFLARQAKLFSRRIEADDAATFWTSRHREVLQQIPAAANVGGLTTWAGPDQTSNRAAKEEQRDERQDG